MVLPQLIISHYSLREIEILLIILLTLPIPAQKI
jgi:hypothetical protein